MGDIKIGNSSITLKLGSSDVTAAYIGSILVYSGGTPPTPTFQGKWLATYQDSHTESAECGYSSGIIIGEITTTNLVDVEIGDCVTSINNSYFSDCSTLTSATIGSGVTEIGMWLFRNCTSLTSIDIPNSVTNISNDAFRGCTSLTSIDIPNSVTNISSSAFRQCISLTSVTIPDSVTSIGNYAFRDCSSLTSITINATNPPTLANANAFNSTNNCPIYVPSGSVDTYKTTSGWSNLASRIQAIPNS